MAWSLGSIGPLVREKEHAKASLLAVTDKHSRFYLAYPSRSSENYTDALRKGFFGDLSMRVGIGWLRSNVASVDALCSQNPAWELEGRGGSGGGEASLGILHWPKSAITGINKLKMNGASFKEKQLRMAGYLFELVYDLLISPRDNVSESPGFPGFESCGVTLSD